MKLYDYFRSSAAYRVRIALNLKGSRPSARSSTCARGAQRADELPRAQSAGPRADAGHRRRRRAHAVARDHRMARRDASAAAAAAGRCRRPRAGARHRARRSPATSIRSTTCACCNYLTGTLGVTDAQKDAWYRHWCDIGPGGAGDAARARAGDRALLPRRRADARRHLPRPAARQRAAGVDRPRAVSDAARASRPRASRCRRSPTRRPRQQPDAGDPEGSADRAPMTTVIPAWDIPSVPVAGSRSALSGASHLLRRPQLRRAREGDGRRRREGAAVLLHQAGRRGRAGRAARRRAACAIRWRPRISTTRSSWSWRSATRGVESRARACARGRLGLRGRPRHDAARPAERDAREEAAVGHRQVVRAGGADRADPSRRRRSGIRRAARSGSTSTACAASRAISPT